MFEGESLPQGIDVKEVELLSPCSQCKTGGMTVARLRRHSVPQLIETQCKACGRKYWLSLDDYGHHFGLDRKKKSTKRGKSKEARDSAIFARYTWCCVYHEGNREAREYRIAQFEQTGLLNPDATSSGSVDELQSILEVSARKMFGVDPENLFGLVRDHLIPVWVQNLLDLTEEEKLRAGRDWIVAGCGKCNGERNAELESVDQLLYLYSRFLMPFCGASALDRLEDLLLFMSVLQKIERYRLASGVEIFSARSSRVAT